ncbi:putative secreted protein [Penaeus vannamei]|uniref:Putative secreted protein n=1 Tax=Penaeus vannamei TaxID=6689 RepID=A0A423SPF5_PENVA|nr:putative secreted protein [Penaeus vannamei]
MVDVGHSSCHPALLRPAHLRGVRTVHEIFSHARSVDGLAWLIVCGLATMISTPFLLHSGIGEDFPWWLLLALMLLCAFLGTYLPETIGLPLPQSFQDAEDLGNGRPLKVWIHHWNHHRFVPISSQEDRYQELRRLSITNPDGLRRMSFSDRKMSR